MSALTCDICGGKLKMGKGKIAVCESCGMEHSVERVREKIQEIKGTVHVDSAHLVENFYSLATDAFQTGNYADAERYCNKILENDPRHTQAAFLKGKAVGWQSTITDFRFKEAATCFANAVNSSSDPEERDSLHRDVEEEFKKLATAMVSVRNDRFSKWPDREESDGFCNDLEEVASAIELYDASTGFAINRNRVFSNVALVVRTTISIVATTKILLEYVVDGSRSAYRTLVDRTDYSIRILEKTADLCDDDDDSDIKIYEQIISMLETVIQNNRSDLIQDKWGAYKESPRLSDYELRNKQNQIRTLRTKIATIKR